MEPFHQQILQTKTCFKLRKTPAWSAG